MLRFHLFKTNSVRPITVKLALMAAAILVVFASLDLLIDQIGKLLPDAEAAPAEAVMPAMPANPEQPSWSEEWFKVHITLPASIVEDISTF